ncbi:galactose-1-phosphate uridylyltransferase [Alicyclobacillus contaminans]|uniref:galactose-1-phosphate uridylyltransferase n=1 Tax=Alicyclobacillus contaminans TaxID=392016 RepID=UPI0003F8904C|nr:galactose-1-phosphate uridylyltransferase [Alicyclobacillus contaminans]GMA50971.1 galactose-1-phosphate uridylyltransferase [Alicyclobacillus contaminans]
MAELRYNPLLRDWTMVASHRQNRPNMPKDFCPFCPGSGRVPDTYDVLKYDNDFPALSQDPPEPDDVGTALYPVKPAYGKCEVILYSPDHHATLPELPVAHIRKLVDLWADRYVSLAANPRHKYVLIFENRGPEVGVTMPHPHGQIYAYPYIPQKLRVELESCEAHRQETGRCLVCDINREEQSAGVRMLVETDHFVSYLPFFTDYPYGAFISSKAHLGSLAEFSEAEKDDLANILKQVTAGMDALFDRQFPYMMVLHQSPVNGPDTEAYYHFHIEFYPPLRAKDKLKYLASSETGAWAPCNPTAVEQTAPELRAAIQRAKGANVHA